MLLITVTGIANESGCCCRKRAQKDKDEKQREEEQALLQQQQQQKELEKAAADAAAKEQQSFVLPGDATLLRYIGQCIERFRALPSAQQQASALAKSVAVRIFHFQTVS